jgi:hypothetical protein
VEGKAQEEEEEEEEEKEEEEELPWTTECLRLTPEAAARHSRKPPR